MALGLLACKVQERVAAFLGESKKQHESRRVVTKVPLKPLVSVGELG